MTTTQLADTNKDPLLKCEKQDSVRGMNNNKIVQNYGIKIQRKIIIARLGNKRLCYIATCSTSTARVLLTQVRRMFVYLFTSTIAS